MMRRITSDPTIPSLTKIIGYTMILDPTMVLAMLVITLKELSVPF